MNRRQFLLTTGHGFGVVALSGLLEGSTVNPLAPKAPHAAAKAKSIIYLFMHGGVSHVDTFDPKPELTKRSGQALSVELAKTIKTSFIHDPTKAVLRGSPWTFRPGGKCGLPGVGSVSQRCANAWTTSPSSEAVTAMCSIMPRQSIFAIPDPSFPVSLVSAPGLHTDLERKIRTCQRLS